MIDVNIHCVERVEVKRGFFDSHPEYEAFHSLRILATLADETQVAFTFYSPERLEVGGEVK